jgi:hypothetical protein
LELLKQTSVCITHAGLNTVLESLAQGVPQVAIPVAYDQPGVAARLVNKQTGVATSLDKLTADHLSTLLHEVLSNSTYRANARRLQHEIAEANGLSGAADLVEQSLGARRPKATPEPVNSSCGYAPTLFVVLSGHSFSLERRSTISLDHKKRLVFTEQPHRAYSPFARRPPGPPKFQAVR